MDPDSAEGQDAQDRSREGETLMIDLYYWPTPNGWKVSIMLEECGLEYRTIPVDIGGGEQFKPEFLRISPNNRMPAIVDHEPLGGGKPLSLFESGAILEYLADKTGKFLPRSGQARYAVLQWVHWQMANLGPMMGNANHFKNYAKQLVDDADQLAYGTRRFVGEVDRLCGVMDAQLSAHRYLAGPDYTIADIVTWPWASLVGRLIDENVWTQFPSLKRWADEVGARPAVERGRHLHTELGERQLTDDEQKRRKEILFNQTNAKVRAAREAAAKAVP
jgi:GST-like protein